MKHLKLLLLSACILGLPACKTLQDVKDDLEYVGIDTTGTGSGAVPPSEDLIGGGKCPEAKAVDELAAFSAFVDPEHPSPDTLISRAFIKDIDRTCEYSERSVTVDLTLELQGALGPMAAQGGTRNFSYPFFVAITSPGGEIIAKEVFNAPMTYAPGQERQIYIERLRQIVPVNSQNSGAHFDVLVGFQLSEDQLAYNREVIRLEMEAQKAAEKARKEAAKLQEEAAENQPAAAPAPAIVIDTAPLATPPPVQRPVPLTGPSPY